jgi:hypothetical protein
MMKIVKFKKLRGFSPLVRAIGVFSAVAVIVGGVTFAALNGSVTLTGNSFSTASSDLKIWDGNAYTDTSQGFTINNLVPGKFSDPNFFYFRNDSGTPLNVSVMASDATVQGVDPSDVTLRFKSFAPGCDNRTVDYTLDELQSAEDPGKDLPCNPLADGATGNSSVQNTAGNFSVQVKVDNVESTGATVSNLDLTFTGTVAQTQ